jgi:hypothetical protein
MMFGRDDESHDNTMPEPEHDAVLGDNNGTVHPDDEHTSPAFTGNAPAAPDDKADVALPTLADDKPVDTPVPTAPDTVAHTDRLDDDGQHGDLIGIKQSALKELSPLVDHLDQTPEEKFRTTMMMIQASDNQELIKDAHAAAQKITDEKTKAQALLDIVNEINYFTQQS